MICKNCKEDKDINDFPLKPNGKIKSYYCKECFYQVYKETSKKSSRRYYNDNRGEIKLKNKEYRENNKEGLSKDKKEYYEENKQKILDRNEKYRKENKDKVNDRRKDYYHKNIEAKRDKKNKYISSRLEVDNLFKLKHTIRCLIRNAFNRKFTIKSKKTSEILGYTFDEFKSYIESKFTSEMNWGNYGTYWHLDHIKPIDLAKNEEEVVELNHYTNFQPLYWKDNLSKSNKYFEE